MTKEEMLAKLTQHIDDKHRDTVDLLRNEIKASEARTEARTVQLIDRTKDEIVAAVSDIVGNGLVPQIDAHHEKLVNHEGRIVILEEKTNV